MYLFHNLSNQEFFIIFVSPIKWQKGGFYEEKISTIILVTMLFLSAYGNTPGNENYNPTTTSSISNAQTTPEQEQLLTGIIPPFELQWGSSIEDCGAKFANDWTVQENTDDSHYVLNQKQSIFGKEGIVTLNFCKKPISDTAPENIQLLPDYFLESISIQFENSAEEIGAELEKQYGKAKSENTLETKNGTLVYTFFSNSDAQVQNMKNENQPKAYHMYRYLYFE